MVGRVIGQLIENQLALLAQTQRGAVDHHQADLGPCPRLKNVAHIDKIADLEGHFGSVRARRGGAAGQRADLADGIIGRSGGCGGGVLIVIGRACKARHLLARNMCAVPVAEAWGMIDNEEVLDDVAAVLRRYDDQVAATAGIHALQQDIASNDNFSVLRREDMYAIRLWRLT